MQISNSGILADVFWHQIKKHVQDIELGEFVVMPNHVHAILIIKNNQQIDDPILYRFDNVNHDVGKCGDVEKRHAFSLGQKRFHQSLVHTNPWLPKMPID